VALFSAIRYIRLSRREKPPVDFLELDAEPELVPVALDQGLGILVWSPIAGGLLSGKYRREAVYNLGWVPADMLDSTFVAPTRLPK